MCRRTLGEKGGEGASLLAPVPAGAVVYGDGEQAMMLSEVRAPCPHPGPAAAAHLLLILRPLVVAVYIVLCALCFVVFSCCTSSLVLVGSFMKLVRPPDPSCCGG